MRAVSYTILIILVIIFISPMNNYNTGYDVFDYPLRSLYHANWPHLIANGLSFFGLSFMEDQIGSRNFLIMIIFIWFVSSAVLYTIFKIFPSREAYTIGFSGVIFGMIVVYFSLLGKGAGITLAGLAISILPQLFVPGISFEGHLSGIIAGVIYVIAFKPRNMVKIPTVESLGQMIQNHNRPQN